MRWNRCSNKPRPLSSRERNNCHCLRCNEMLSLKSVAIYRMMHSWSKTMIHSRSFDVDEWFKQIVTYLSSVGTKFEESFSKFDQTILGNMVSLHQQCPTDWLQFPVEYEKVKICNFSHEYRTLTEDEARRSSWLLLSMTVARRIRSPAFLGQWDRMNCSIGGIAGTLVERHVMCDPSLQLYGKHSIRNRFDRVRNRTLTWKIFAIFSGHNILSNILFGFAADNALIHFRRPIIFPCFTDRTSSRFEFETNCEWIFGNQDADIFLNVPAMSGTGENYGWNPNGSGDKLQLTIEPSS